MASRKEVEDAKLPPLTWVEGARPPFSGLRQPRQPQPPPVTAREFPHPVRFTFSSHGSHKSDCRCAEDLDEKTPYVPSSSSSSSFVQRRPPWYDGVLEDTLRRPRPEVEQRFIPPSSALGNPYLPQDSTDAGQVHVSAQSRQYFGKCASRTEACDSHSLSSTSTDLPECPRCKVLDDGNNQKQAQSHLPPPSGRKELQQVVPTAPSFEVQRSFQTSRHVDSMDRQEQYSRALASEIGSLRCPEIKDDAPILPVTAAALPLRPLSNSQQKRGRASDEQQQREAQNASEALSELPVMPMTPTRSPLPPTHCDIPQQSGWPSAHSSNSSASGAFHISSSSSAVQPGQQQQQHQQQQQQQRDFKSTWRKKNFSAHVSANVTPPPPDALPGGTHVHLRDEILAELCSAASEVQPTRFYQIARRARGVEVSEAQIQELEGLLASQMARREAYNRLVAAVASGDVHSTQIAADVARSAGVQEAEIYKALGVSVRHTKTQREACEALALAVKLRDINSLYEALSRAQSEGVGEVELRNASAVLLEVEHRYAKWAVLAKCKLNQFAAFSAVRMKLALACEAGSIHRLRLALEQSMSIGLPHSEIALAEQTLKTLEAEADLVPQFNARSRDLAYLSPDPGAEVVDQLVPQLKSQSRALSTREDAETKLVAASIAAIKGDPLWDVVSFRRELANAQAFCVSDATLMTAEHALCYLMSRDRIVHEWSRLVVALVESPSLLSRTKLYAGFKRLQKEMRQLRWAEQQIKAWEQIVSRLLLFRARKGLLALRGQIQAEQRLRDERSSILSNAWALLCSKVVEEHARAQSAAAQVVAAAFRNLEAAIRKGSIPELQNAIENAIQAGVPERRIAHARITLRTLEARVSAEVELRTALVSEDLGLLRAAVRDAKSVGVVGGTLVTAEHVLSEMDEKEAAQQALHAAVTGGDLPVLRAALVHAQAVAVDAGQIAFAQRAIRARETAEAEKALVNALEDGATAGTLCRALETAQASGVCTGLVAKARAVLRMREAREKAEQELKNAEGSHSEHQQRAIQRAILASVPQNVIEEAQYSWQSAAVPIVARESETLSGRADISEEETASLHSRFAEITARVPYVGTALNDWVEEGSVPCHTEAVRTIDVASIDAPASSNDVDNLEIFSIPNMDISLQTRHLGALPALSGSGLRASEIAVLKQALCLNNAEASQSHLAGDDRISMNAIAEDTEPQDSQLLRTGTDDLQLTHNLSPTLLRQEHSEDSQFFTQVVLLQALSPNGQQATMIQSRSPQVSHDVARSLMTQTPVFGQELSANHSSFADATFDRRVQAHHHDPQKECEEAALALSAAMQQRDAGILRAAIERAKQTGVPSIKIAVAGGALRQIERQTPSSNSSP